MGLPACFLLLRASLQAWLSARLLQGSGEGAPCLMRSQGNHALCEGHRQALPGGCAMLKTGVRAWDMKLISP